MFTATDATDGSTVALKVYNPERSGDTYRVESFRRESVLLSQLSGQKDIVQIVSPGSQFTLSFPTPQGFVFSQQLEYYALELAEGDALGAITNSSWTSAQSLRAFAAMCRAVQRVHSNNIAHRDLKPENFFLMSDGAVRLGDFGAAAPVRGAASSSRLLTSYALWQLGDPRYAAPEVIASLHDDAAAISLLSDIYSLGAILFELFTGQVLGLQVFDAGFWARLAVPMAVVPRGNRQAVFDLVVDQIVASQPLPSLTAYGRVVPPSIANKLDRLYRAMAHLDYRRRLADFSSIFNEINACSLILKNEAAYLRWKAQRARRRK